MSLSSPGIGSNLDVNSLIAQLMALERRPLTLLQKREADYQARLSAVGTLKSALSQFQTAVAALAKPSRFAVYTATLSDPQVATATAGKGSVAGVHSLEVTQLAQAQKLVSVAQASTTATIGTGTLTIDFGTISGGSFDPATGKYTGATFTPSGAASKTVTIDAAHASLAGIRDAINEANIGVTASIVNDGSGYRLVLASGTSGAAGSLRIAVSGDAALANLLAHDPAGTQNLSERVTAKDARFTLDGIAITSASNTVTGALEGVTLTLTKTNAGTPATLTIVPDTASIRQGVESFVEAYNKLAKTLKDLGGYDPATGTAGVLQSDGITRLIESRLRSTLSAELVGLSGGYTALYSLGITSTTDGTLQVDTAKLEAAIQADPGGVAGLFAATGKASDSLVRFVSGSALTKPGVYDVSIDRLATRGSVTGSSAANTTIDAGVNDTLTLSVDGITTTITLAAGSYTAAGLAAELQSKINGAAELAAAGVTVSVTESGGVLTVTSNRYGSASTVTLGGGNAQSSLFGTNPTSTAGVDVAGSIGGVAAIGVGRTLTAAAGTAADGLTIEVLGGATGARGTVSYSQGYAYRLERLAADLLDNDGLVAGRSKTLDATIDSLQRRQEEMERRLETVEKRLRAQFVALDAMVASMLKTSSFLQQQLATLPTSSS
ncbi:flagellar filament capping protein FliD [Pelomicrobium methylotrophicum]|uniref:Flagellar hook-associated protein 2 n=1 Tax=Pelomicrobium methylotrophicum TaxID=2602750 RepID=A0A5C7EU96_9PROT|nr:flagellar filament capping protein FliD [Pelomicrobium methylotrophicum]TXF11798.1 flagellar hook protein FliD [Pelomicrobium methylotrophicum]